MQLIDAQGSRLTAKLFIDTFKAVKKAAPARFWTLKLHPDRYNDIFLLADIPMSIQMGRCMGPLNKPVMRVNCVLPPLGIMDGITMIQDVQMDPTQLVFLLHGIVELVLQNLTK